MSTFTTFILLLLAIVVVSNNVNNVTTSNQDLIINSKVVRVLSAMKWAKGTLKGQLLNKEAEDQSYNECVKLYEETEPRLGRLVVFGGDHHKYNYSHDDALTWLSAALASHRSCLDGLKEKGLATFISRNEEAQNLTLLLKDALFHYRQLTTLSRTGESYHFTATLIGDKIRSKQWMIEF